MRFLALAITAALCGLPFSSSYGQTSSALPEAPVGQGRAKDDPVGWCIMQTAHANATNDAPLAALARSIARSCLEQHGTSEDLRCSLGPGSRCTAIDYELFGKLRQLREEFALDMLLMSRRDRSG